MQSFESDITVNGSNWDAKFSASAGFREIKEGTSKDQFTFIETASKVIIYEASVTGGISLDESFIQDVTSLPLEGSSLSSYLDFIYAYGTHFVAEVVMGAKIVQQNKFDSAKITSLKVGCFFDKLETF